MKILGISGSLKTTSKNSVLVRAIQTFIPTNWHYTIYNGLDDLPHFSPERDIDPAPEAVQKLRSLLQTADAVLICTPEYAHGMPGSLKNALDWTVSSGEFVNKPVAALSASPSMMGGDKAHAGLVQTLTVLSAIIPEEAKIIIPGIPQKLDSNGELMDGTTIQRVKQMLEVLAETVVKGN
ncbi:flavoprotein [Adhaeribacter arboris]|uniref:Flavoprotein n=1 Tax=Adhaeribacter arboris TaxID=2072846 RepID=A0A2T2YA85_9BACT|nr:NADPH-dependent FMN reductase [Adhaeribacter arboris]PSR52441.1 flavoprotein [Adhaeribacter arboris]